jgi:hypothetical protein
LEANSGRSLEKRAKVEPIKIDEMATSSERSTFRDLEIATAADENTNAPLSIKHNAENAFVLWNVPEIAKVYAKEWDRLWEESR